MCNLDKSENWGNWDKWDKVKRNYYALNNVLDYNLNEDYIMAISYSNMSIILF